VLARVSILDLSERVQSKKENEMYNDHNISINAVSAMAISTFRVTLPSLCRYRNGLGYDRTHPLGL
jgi:hypothetical protein